MTHIKSKASSVMHEAGENNMLPSQAITSDANEEAVAGAATPLSLISASTKTQPARVQIK